MSAADLLQEDDRKMPGNSVLPLSMPGKSPGSRVSFQHRSCDSSRLAASAELVASCSGFIC